MKCLNSIFSNFYRMVHGWPANHTFKNLKHKVILNLIEDCDEMATKLQPH